MPSNRRKALVLASLTFGIVASFAPIAPAVAGPISDMLARHRQQRAMKLPPMDKPFAMKPFHDPNAPSLTQKFKQRFSFKHGASDGLFSGTHDAGVIKTSK